MLCLSFFSYIFGRFSLKFRWKHRLILFTSARVFFNWRPSRNTVNYDTKPTSSFFALFIFFLKKQLKKWVQNWTPKKTSKKGPTGTQNGPPNHENWDGQILKISKIAPKYCFLRGRFFDDFLDGQKTDPRGYSTLKAIKIYPPLGSTGG